MKRSLISSGAFALLVIGVVTFSNFSGSVAIGQQGKESKATVKVAPAATTEETAASATNEAAPTESLTKAAPVAAKNTESKAAPAGPSRAFVATCYSLRGRMANGAFVHRGAIAADPRVLPIGTRVYLKAGSLSGEYVVKDTGGAIKGKRIDIWVPSTAQAMNFGRRGVQLTVLSGRAKTAKAK